MARLSSYQIAEWEEEGKLSPFGEVRDDFHSAQICTVIANFAKSFGKKKRREFTVSDFMLPLERKKKEDSKTMWQKIKLWAEAHNSRIKNKEE